jgi:ankyrin repeat protein
MNVQNRRGRTALHLAACSGRRAAATALLRLGAVSGTKNPRVKKIRLRESMVPVGNVQMSATRTE